MKKKNFWQTILLVFLLFVLLFVMFYSGFLEKEKVTISRDFSWSDAFNKNSNIPLIMQMNDVCKSNGCRVVTIGSDKVLKKGLNFCNVSDSFGFYEFSNIFEKHGVFFQIKTQISGTSSCCVFCVDNNCSKTVCDSDPAFVKKLFESI